MIWEIPRIRRWGGASGPARLPATGTLLLVLVLAAPPAWAVPAPSSKEQANSSPVLRKPAFSAEPLPEGFAEDAHGRRFRVRFDTGSRLLLGVGLAFGGAAEERGRPRERLQAGLAYRSLLEYAEGDAQVTWQLDHLLLAGQIEPRDPGYGAVPALDAAVYRGVFLRHASSSTITLPTNPPKQLYFPLDMGLQTELGRLVWPGQAAAGAAAGADRVARLGLAQATVLFDPWRSGRAGNSLELGVGSRYGIDLLFPRGAAWAAPQLVHRVAPFTATSLRWRLQDAAGLTATDLHGELVPHWASRGGWLLAAQAQLRLERVLIALNDEPLAAYAELRWARWPGPPPVDQSELQASVGLAVLWQLR